MGMGGRVKEMVVTRPAPLEAELVAVFRRRTDLGDELPKPACYVAAKAKGHVTFRRVRVGADEGPVPVSSLGLHDSLEWQRSYRSVYCADGGDPARGGERALCVQTTAHVKSVLRFEKSLLRQEGPVANKSLKQKLESPMHPGCWGENLHLDGGERFTAAAICVGDEFSVFRRPDDGAPVLITQVSMPRCPCSKVDMRFGRTFTRDGVRCHCARTGHAGFFLRVLRPGTLQAGDVFRLTARPHPKWTLARIQALLYGSDQCQMKYLKRGILREEWMGTQAELEELAGIQELGVFEYKEELCRMIPLRPAIGQYASGKAKYAGGWDWSDIFPHALVGVFLSLPLAWPNDQSILLAAVGLASLLLWFSRAKVSEACVLCVMGT